MTLSKIILITGGAGFIGSHTCLVLLEAGYRLIVLDNFSNSSPESLRLVQGLAGAEAGNRLVVEGDTRLPGPGRSGRLASRPQLKHSLDRLFRVRCRLYRIKMYLFKEPPQL